MVYGTYNYSYWGESKPTSITGGGGHIVGGFSYETPVPKLQLPLHSGRENDGRSDGRSRPRSKRSARLTSQCSTVTWAKTLLKVRAD